MNHRVRIFSVLIYFSICFTAVSQKVASDINFKHLNTEKGLPSNITYSLTQDSTGFIWIASSDGLARFDGYSTKIFRRGMKSTDLQDNFIYDVFVDSKSRIWVGTNYNGLFLYDPVTEAFSHVSINLARNNNSDLVTVRKIREGPKGKLWLATQTDGVIVLDPESYRFDHLVRQPDGLNGIVSNEIIDIAFDNHKHAWIASRDSGITVLDTARNKLINFTEKNLNTKGNFYNTINSLYYGANNTMYIGTRSAAIAFQAEDSSFTSLVDKETYAFLVSKQNGLYIGTSEGIFIAEENEQQMRQYRNVSAYPNSLSNNLIRYVFEDNSGVIWFCTRAGGVNYFYPSRKEFETFSHDPAQPNSLSHNLIRSFAHDGDGNLWVATVQNGIDILSAEDQKFYNINTDSFNGIRFQNTSLVKLFTDRNKNIWIGTWGQGLFKLDRGSKTIRPVAYGKFTSNIILDIYEDSQGNMWIGTENGLDIYNPTTDKIRSFMHNPDRENTITPFGVQSNCIVEDINGDFWVGNYGGLNYLKRKHFSERIFDDDFLITNYTNASEKHIKLNDNRIINIEYKQDIYPDKLIVGSYGGGLHVVHFEENGAELIKVYTTVNGLSNNVVYASLIDSRGDIWISTTYGLTKFDARQYRFKSYGPNDGLQDYQFFWGASMIDSVGNLYFGGVSGYNKFHPQKIVDDDYIPPVVLTDLRIFNRSIKVGDTINKRIILQESINEIEMIELGPHENMFSIGFSALHFAYPEDNSYEYMLEGFDDDYIAAHPDQRLATYTNLDAGTYTFKVRGSNFDGLWNPIDKKLKIKITPPFRKTLTFRILVILLTALVTGSYFLLKLRQEKHLGSILQRSVEEKTSELNKSNKLLQLQAKELVTANRQLTERSNKLNEINEQLEKRQQKVEDQAEELRSQAEVLQSTNIELEKSNAAKDKFFSILSHDLKNPFSFILGSSEVLYRQFKKLPEDKKQSYAKRIYNAAESTYNLLENLLTWSRTQRKKIVPDPIKIKVFDVVNQCIQVLDGKIKSKELSIERKIDDSLIVIADNNMLYTIILNILTNAIKFSNIKGSIQLSATRKNQFVEIVIKDDGVGMSKEKVSSLFQIDKTVSTEGTKGETGTGLGLILCHEFVTANNGHIAVSGEEGKGTTVSISLPTI